MRSLPADYMGIYDPLTNPDHMRTRLIPETCDRSQHYAHYEPYGCKSKEKEDYIESINQEHELWSSPLEDKDREKKVSIAVEGLFMTRDSYQLNGQLWPGQYMSDVFLRVPHTLEMEVIYPEMWNEEIDTSDRAKKASYAFAQMLADYVEKCSESEKKIFFDRGGKGWKWSQDKELMKKVGKLFERVNCNIRNDPNYRISLSDISLIPAVILVDRGKRRAFNPVPSKIKFAYPIELPKYGICINLRPSLFVSTSLSLYFNSTFNGLDVSLSSSG